MDITLNIENSKVFDKIPSVFGNGAHVFVSKDYMGKKVKIIIGNSKIKKNKLQVDFFNSEILERIVTGFGTGAHIILPKENIGKKIKLILEGVKN
jgi:putative transposon-encoded protein